MAMFGRFEDWGLQAVVGDSNNIDKMENVQGQSTSGIWGMPQDDESFFLGFPLETLYKPFYKVKDSISTQVPTSFSPSFSLSSSTPKEVKTELKKVEVIERSHHHQEVIQPKADSEIVRQLSSSSTALTTGYSPRFKKRKNQQKRVVTQVKAEEYLTSDKWAWRKYGQKPIKGSPYPRSYYRCSSMKGCLARKQVEQSCIDPEVYIITYTEEHCHSQPTRRNSLAGTVRNKFPATPRNPIIPTMGGNNSPPLPSNEDISSTSLPLNDSSEEELSGTHFKQENIDEELRTMQWGCNSNGDPLIISDFLMYDDFFYGLEDLNCPKV